MENSHDATSSEVTYSVLVSLRISTSSLHSTLLHELTQALPDNCKLSIPSNNDDYLRYLKTADILISSRVTGDMMDSSNRLKMIHAIGTGVDSIDVDRAFEKGIIVCNAVGLNAIPVAEHAFALMLALAKKITRFDAELKATRWYRAPTTLLQGKILGIIGLGHIGSEIARSLWDENLRHKKTSF